MAFLKNAIAHKNRLSVLPFLQSPLSWRALCQWHENQIISERFRFSLPLRCGSPLRFLEQARHCS
jgi:hypothetical protein